MYVWLFFAYTYVHMCVYFILDLNEQSESWHFPWEWNPSNVSLDLLAAKLLCFHPPTAFLDAQLPSCYAGLLAAQGASCSNREVQDYREQATSPPHCQLAGALDKETCIISVEFFTDSSRIRVCCLLRTLWWSSNPSGTKHNFPQWNK